MGAFEEAKEWLIESFGMQWPDTDEGKCRQAANAWEEYAGAIGDVRRATDGKATALIHNNRGEAIDAFEVFWHRYYHKEAGWLWDLEKAARAMAKSLNGLADAVEEAKDEIDTKIAIEATVIAAGIGLAVFTAGLASGPAMAAATVVAEAAGTVCGTMGATAATVAVGAIAGATIGGVESVVVNLAVAQPLKINAGLQDGYNWDSVNQASKNGMIYGGVFGGALSPFMKNLPFNGVRMPHPGLRPGSPADLAAGSRPPKGIKADLDPIDVATGTMLLPQTDVELPGALPLVFERTHQSSYRSGGWFGPTWASTLDERVQIDLEGVVFAAADGMRLVYPVPTPGGPTLPVAGPRWPLVWDGKPEGALTITDPAEGTTRTFADPTPAGQDGALDLPLVWTEDRNGARIDIDRTETGAPVAVRHSGGYHLAVETQGPRVTALRLLDEPPSPYDPAQPWREPSGTLLARYGYDERGDLTEVVNSSGNPLRFTYDAEGRITSWTDRNDTSYGYIYDARGRVVRTEGSGGFLTGTLAYDDAARRVTVTNSLGHTRVYEHDDAFQITAETDELGHTNRTTWKDTGTQPLTVTDPLGRTTRYTYDEAGNLTAVTLPDGSTTHATYNALGLPLEVTEPGGARWQHTWDEQGNLLSTTDPCGAESTYAYNPSGHLTTITDALSHTRRVTCDPAGLPATVTDGLGHTTTVARDPLGRVTAVTDPLGHITTMGWTPEGKPAWRELPDGARESWTWDAEGNLVAHTDPSGNTTRHTHGPFDLPVTRIEPDGAEFAFAYDAELRLTQVTNPQGLHWTYDYDPAGRLTAETDFDGRTLAYAHDAAGQLAYRTNGAGEHVSYGRDALGRVCTATDSAGAETTYSYSSAGHLAQASNPDHTIIWDHDPLGRVLTERVDGRTTRYERDALGRVTRRTTPGGADSHWTWDEGGRPTRLATNAGTLEFSHNPLGQEVARHLGPDVALAQTWDRNGRLATQSVTRGVAAGEGSGAPGECLIHHRAYTHRLDSHVTEISELASGTRRFDLDGQGRVTSVTAHGWSETYAYDEAGNLAQAARTPNLSPAAGEPDTGTEPPATRAHSGTLLHRADRTTYAYDEQGRLTRQTRKLLNGQTRTIKYIWNAYDQLTDVTTREGERWHYTYDALGRRITKRLVTAANADADPPADAPPEGTFTWDGTRLAEQVTADGHTTTWDYAPGTHTPVAQTTRVTPIPAPDAPASAITQLTARNTPHASPAFYAVLTDHTGTPTELVTPDGHTAWQHRTTLWGTPLPQPSGLTPTTADCPLRFPGQYADSETGLHYNYFRYYNPHSARYLTPDPLGLGPAANHHAYVSNPLSQIDPEGLNPCRQTVANSFNVRERAVVNRRKVFRGDTRNPSEVFGTGFSAKGSNTDIGRYALHDTPSAWVGTSKSAKQASWFPQSAQGRGTWVYEIRGAGYGVDVNKAMGGSIKSYISGKGFPSEREIVYSGIDPSSIVRAVRYKYGQPTGEVIENPGFTP